MSRQVLLIDDERSILPDGTIPTAIVRNYRIAYSLLLADALVYFDTVAVDHDLGGELTGYDWISQVERLYFDKRLFLPAEIVCVSDNPPGRARIKQVIDSLRLLGGDHRRTG